MADGPTKMQQFDSYNLLRGESVPIVLLPVLQGLPDLS